MKQIHVENFFGGTFLGGVRWGVRYTLGYCMFYVAAAQKCSNTTKMGFCKCRHLLTIKSIFLILFMLLVWLCKRPNLKYELKLKRESSMCAL